MGRHRFAKRQFYSSSELALQDYRTAFCINCGGTVDVGELTGCLPPSARNNVRLVFIDSHRPIHHSFNDERDQNCVLLHDPDSGDVPVDSIPVGDSALDAGPPRRRRRLDENGSQGNGARHASSRRAPHSMGAASQCSSPSVRRCITSGPSRAVHRIRLPHCSMPRRRKRRTRCRARALLLARLALRRPRRVHALQARLAAQPRQQVPALVRLPAPIIASCLSPRQQRDK
jgi:hypothetical protein